MSAGDIAKYLRAGKSRSGPNLVPQERKSSSAQHGTWERYLDYMHALRRVKRGKLVLTERTCVEKRS